MATSRDWKLFFSGSREETVRRWDGESEESVGELLRGHENEVTLTALSEDGRVFQGRSRPRRRKSAEED